MKYKTALGMIIFTDILLLWAGVWIGGAESLTEPFAVLGLVFGVVGIVLLFMAMFKLKKLIPKEAS